jgi:uncharacterized protein YqjF (DUF2071 family)
MHAAPRLPVPTALDPRPYPPPRLPWIMKQVWHDLLFAHWPFDPAAVRPLVPPQFPLDTFDGRAWIGVVPFRVAGLRPRALPPLPPASSFPELNVRTYVTRDGKPGVYFFSLDAGSRLAVEAARLVYHLPYARARMSVAQRGPDVVYASVRTDPRFRPAALRARYRPVGPVALARPGTLDHWLTARYCLYTLDGSGAPRRCEIDHPPWPLQPATAEFEENAMVRPLGLALPTVPPLLHFSRRLPVHVWWLGHAGPEDVRSP